MPLTDAFIPCWSLCNSNGKQHATPKIKVPFFVIRLRFNIQPYD